MSLKKTTSSNHTGFTIIEMAVVMTVIAMAVAGGLSIISRDLNTAKIRETERRMAYVMKAVEDYVAAFGGVPCPSNLWLLPNHIYFGNGQISSGNCQYSDSADDSGNVTVYNLFAGGVPTSSLALHPMYMLDGWGRRFVYIMDGDSSDNIANAGDISVVDAAGNSLILDDAGATAKAAVLLISYGQNGYGSHHLKTTGQLPDALGRGVASRNMEDANIFAKGITTLSDTYRLLPLRESEGTDPTSGSNEGDEIFDDILLYRTHWALQNPGN